MTDDSNEDGPDLVTLGSRTVYENRWMRVREDRTRRRDGSEALYGVIEKNDYVVVAPIDAGMVHLVEQYRYPIGSRQWEFPQGAWEGDAKAAPLDLARGELREETGLVAETMTEVGHLYPMYAAVSNSYRIFLATGLSFVGHAREPDEQDMITRAFPLKVFEAMVLDGEIRDAGTVASFGLLRLKGLV